MKVIAYSSIDGKPIYCQKRVHLMYLEKFVSTSKRIIKKLPEYSDMWFNEHRILNATIELMWKLRKEIYKH